MDIFPSLFLFTLSYYFSSIKLKKGIQDLLEMDENENSRFFK